MKLQGFVSTDPSEPDIAYGMDDFVNSPLGHGLFMATKAGYQFPGTESIRDLTELQLLFFHRAEIERQRRFLEALGSMFEE